MLVSAMPSGPAMPQPTDIISIVLWIPFVLVMLTAGLTFAISGYKKGLWRALIGFGATILAAVLSMLLASLVGKLIAPVIVNLIPFERFELDGPAVGIVNMVVQAAVQYVIALVLFSVLLFLFTIILRAIGNNIAPGKLQPKGKALKFCGMAVGLVCALTYTLLLLMPLYGTLAAYAPVVEDVMAMSGNKDQEDALSAYLKAITKHPVVQMSGSAPIAAVYGSTTQISVGENGMVSIAGLAEAGQDAMELLDQIKTADESQRPQLCYELISLLRNKIADQPWLYDLAMEAKDQLKEIVLSEDTEIGQEVMAGPSALVIWDLLDLLDLSREEFQTNVTAILDFALYALEHDGYNILMKEDFDVLYNSDIVLEAGKLANVTDQAVAVKNMLWSQYAFRLCGEDTQKIRAFMDQYPLPKLTDDKQLRQEAHALMLSMGFNGKSTPAEFVLAHPTLGEKVFNELVAEYGFAAVIGVEDPELAGRINGSTKLQQQYLDMLQQIVKNPLGDTSMTAMIEASVSLQTMIRDGYWDGDYYVSPTTMGSALGTVGKSAFTASGANLSGGSYFYDFLYAYSQLDSNTYPLEEMASMYGIDTMWQVIHLINKNKIPTSLDNYYDALERGEDVYYIDAAFMNDGVVAVMKQLNGAKGSDPLGLGKKLSSSQKRFIKDYLDEQIQRINDAGSQNGGYFISGSPSGDVRYEMVIGGEEGVYDGTLPNGSVGYITVGPDGTIQLPDGMNGDYTIIDGNMGYIAGDGNMIILPGEGGYAGIYYDSTYFTIEERAQIILKFFGI